MIKEEETIPIRLFLQIVLDFSAIMMSEEELYEKWHDYLKQQMTPKQYRKNGPRYIDDEFMDVMLLIVLDDMPVKVCLDFLPIYGEEVIRCFTKVDFECQ